MDYKFNINNFEGPLDLLLHLIKEQKVDIFEVSILELTTQYLSYINEAKAINLEVASDYLVMASTLIEIKSKMLLPKPVIDFEDEYHESSEQELINQLILYKRYKEVTGLLKEYNDDRSLIYTKACEDTSQFNDNSQIIFKEEVELYDLVKAMEKMFQRVELQKPLSTRITHSEISVDQRKDSIIEQIKAMNKKDISMIELLDIKTRSYLIVTFLALLELAKQNQISITQYNNFNNILVNEVS